MDNIKKRFVVRRGFFNQPYRSIRLRNCEITIDNLYPLDENCFQLAICTPYNERLDKIKHKRGIGAGEVKRNWYFECEEDIYEFIKQNPLFITMIQ